jgi:hypothetical protein
LADPAPDAILANREKLNKMPLIDKLRSRKKALTVEELAGMLRVSMRTLYKEVEDDHILRSSIRFDARQIADWLEMKKMPAHSVRTRRQNESIDRA